MSAIHFVGGEKGGVGKSVVARLLAQLFIDRGLAFAALDGDRSNAALLRYYADFTERVELDQLESTDPILESALAAERNVLVDLPAQSHHLLQRWFEETDVLRYAQESGVSLVFWHVTDGGFDSVSHLERLLGALSGDVQFVIVENQGRSKDFSQFEASAARQRVLELGGRIVRVPELDASVMYKIDRFGSSFWAAINGTSGERALSALERRRAKVWLGKAHSVLEPAVLGAAIGSEAPSADAAPRSPRASSARAEAAPGRGESLDGNGLDVN
ncbi:MAG TPA: division plane positioning ATPase MipZ [Polyangiaceae bacterium]|nr:division plane positioning ATPase MipZ [Polyangiaceae bacterium]